MSVYIGNCGIPFTAVSPSKYVYEYPEDDFIKERYSINITIEYLNEYGKWAVSTIDKLPEGGYGVTYCAQFETKEEAAASFDAMPIYEEDQ